MPSKEVEIAKAYEALVKALNDLEELGEEPLRGIVKWPGRAFGTSGLSGDVRRPEGERWHCTSRRAEEAPYKRGDSVRLVSESASYFGRVDSAWPSGNDVEPWLIKVEVPFPSTDKMFGVLCGPNGECDFMERLPDRREGEKCSRCSTRLPETSCRICHKGFCGECFTDHHHEGYGVPLTDNR